MLSAIEYLFDCAQACITESDVDMLKQCIRLNLDCADVCQAAGSLASRRNGSNERLLRATLLTCQTACELCEQECGRHTDHAHCRICAEACRECRSACHEAALSITPS